MKKSILPVIIALISSQAFATSERIYSCFGGRKAEGFSEGFRLNIIKTPGGQLKAVLSGGYTTRNSLFTWNLAEKVQALSSVYTNTNKSPLEIYIDQGRKIAVSIGNREIRGFSSQATLDFEIKPYGRPAKKYSIYSPMVCSIDE